MEKARLPDCQSQLNLLGMETVLWLIYIFGGVGTFLAAVRLELWIALTTALAAAFTTFLEYRQVENTLIKYNQAETNLANVQTWWMALPAEEQTDPKNIDKLVGYTEKILQDEHTGWAQEMQDALAELRAEQIEKTPDVDNKLIGKGIGKLFFF